LICGVGDLFENQRPRDRILVSLALEVPTLYHELTGKISTQDLAIEVAAAVRAGGPPSQVPDPREQEQVIGHVLELTRLH
jgi:hypothetical protein